MFENWFLKNCVNGVKGANLLCRISLKCPKSLKNNKIRYFLRREILSDRSFYNKKS